MESTTTIVTPPPQKKRLKKDEPPFFTLWSIYLVHMSHLFDVLVVTMTSSFVKPNSIDIICIGHYAHP